MQAQVTVPSNCEKKGVLLYTIPECNENAYELVFEDDFNGTKLDTSKWELPCCFYGALQGSQHIEFNSLENVTVLDGVCKMTAKKETVLRRVTYWYDSSAILDDGLPNLRTFDYTSGSMWTKKKFFHGKYEARCRMPKGKGFWPAFWMYGGTRGNEIDIFDSYGGTDKLVTNILHDFEGNNKLLGCNETYPGYDLTQWHTFGCIFDFDKISFLVDDQLVRVVHRIVSSNGQPINCGDNIAAGTYFHLKSYPLEQMRIILNLALISPNGPAGSSALDATTPLPSTFEIDYVKVWKQGMEEINLSISPNPASEQITVTSNVRIKSLSIYNSSGQKILFSTVENTYFVKEIENLPNGIYNLTAMFEVNYKSRKFIKLSPN
ncbi:MAG: family 16 glycosylhydrolase [Bacteroidetes bacterium]|nr:family 16 glycosylhydrolase [Bacteroidota bacterium]